MADGMGLTELLRAAALSGASVAYEARGEGIRGRVTVREGKVVQASAAATGGPPLNGRAALDALLAKQATLVVEPVASSPPPRPASSATATSATASSAAVTSSPPRPAEARRVPPLPKAPPVPATPPPMAPKRKTLPPPAAAPPAPPEARPAEENESMSEPANPFQAIVEQMRSSAPGSVAAGIFSIEDGLMLGVDSSVPDTNVDAMSGSHVRIVDQIMKFAELLPDRIRGELHSVVLELAETSFFMTMDEDRRIAIMLAGDHVKGNLGYIRLVAKRQIKKTVAVLDGI